MDQPDLDEKLNQLIDEAKEKARKKNLPFWLRFLMSLAPSNYSQKGKTLFSKISVETKTRDGLARKGEISQETLEKLKSLTSDELLGLGKKKLVSSSVVVRPISSWVKNKTGQEIFSKNFSEDSAENLSKLVKADWGPSLLFKIIFLLVIGILILLTAVYLK